MQCPKCGYIRKANDSAPEGECPSCGIIYAKFRLSGTALPSQRSTPVRGASSSMQSGVHPIPSVKSNQVRMPVWLITLFLGVVVGYFSGREHIKYELRETLQGATDSIKRNLGAATSVSATQTEKKEIPPAKLSEPTTFSVVLEKKKFQDADYKASVDAAILFALNFKNLTGKDVRAFDGILVFSDLLDNVIIPVKIAINDSVSADSQINWTGQLNYNQFMEKHKRLRNEEFQNIKIRFETKKILFADGTVKEFD